MTDTRDESIAQPHSTRLLLFVLVSLFLANIGQWAVCRVAGLGSPGGIKDFFLDFAHMRQWTDSWLPMLKSLDYFHAHPTEPIYYAHLYDTLIYPLASLLPLAALERMGFSEPAILRVLVITSWLAVLGVAAVSLWMGQRLLQKRGMKLDWQSVLAVFLACIFCYPLIKGYALGNAQTFLSFLFAVLLLLWTGGSERSGGVVAALLAFVKPQYALLWIWMIVRRRWNAAIAFLITAIILIGVSTLVFGWRNNLDYVHVLTGLSRKAQSHYANQSMFGTLNRMIGNGENITYTPHLYTPYIAWIYRATLLTAIVLIGGALFFPWGRLRGSTGDLAATGLASVAASPMAWEHHYGIVFAIAAWVWFGYGCRQRRPPWLLAIASFLTLNGLTATNFLAPHLGWNILQSYLYFGALLMIFVLMKLARNVTSGAAEPVP
ncbi:MAG TPA: glycosyltransferase family 87 protein [Candidatus Aquilonibacter sp.]|nr:glycosyltransferase family 87 protein [Candidatus Aquilonibacter sp.]